MSNHCFKINDLNVPGTRQAEREQIALRGSYVQPDERSMTALLMFISNYAKLIRYYSDKVPENQDYLIDGNWEPLIMSNEAFHYAGIAITPATLPNITFYRWVNQYEKGSTRQQRFAAWRVLWDILFSVYRDINQFYTKLPAGMELRTAIGKEIEHQLTANFMNAMARYLNAAEAEMIPEIAKADEVPAPGDYVLYEATSPHDDQYSFGHAFDIIAKGFDKVWIHESRVPAKWDSYFQELWGMDTEALYTADISGAFIPHFFGDAGLTGFDRIDYATIHIRRLFERAFGTYNRIIQIAVNSLQTSLTQKSNHQAHHGLLLAFLQLFGKLQVALNQMSLRHLQFYYEKVLQLKPGRPKPDSVNVCLQPAKNVEQHMVPTGTLLQGGKDADGQQLLYATQTDCTIGQAAVAMQKTIYVKLNATGVEQVFASPDSLKANGVEGDPAEGSWPAFADGRQLANATVDSKAQAVGWAIAAPVLHLTEGLRKIIITFTTNTDGRAKIVSSAWSTAWLRQVLQVQLSGAKGWLNADNVSVGLTYFAVSAATNTFRIELTLPQDFEAVVGYDAAICDGGLPTHFPVIRFLLDQNIPAAYDWFKDVALQQVQVKVEVSGIKALTLFGPQGKLDAANAFQPFGAAPALQSSLYVGHPELAHKQISTATLNLAWQEYNGGLKSYYDYRKGHATTTTNYLGITNNQDFKVSLDLLRNKGWISLGSNINLINAANTNIANTLALTVPQVPSLPEVFDEKPLTYDVQTQTGFLRIRLTAPTNAFGHKLWPKLLSERTIAYANNQNDNTLPNPPYVPVAQSATLSYHAQQTISLNADVAQRGFMYSIMPFGYKTIEPLEPLVSAFEGQIKNADGTVETREAESVWYIGIREAKQSQQLSLLLQVHEGSEDISIDPPEVHINYLSKAGWQHIGDYLQSNDTGGMLRSGVVQLIVPNDTQMESTELPAGLFWLAIWTNSNGGGLPQAVNAHTNAVKATLHNQQVHPAHFDKALPPMQVSKLLLPNAAVKKVEQLYSGFGGAAAEAGHLFYTRISERLRHKQRAITIWDYERLVLQAFPVVYMVKCLNHTGYTQACGDDTMPAYRENIPGQLMLIPLPFANKVQQQQIFQPVFSQATLQSIREFIAGGDAAASCTPYVKPLNCGLAKLHVENPVYEPVTVECYVRIRPCKDPFFYKGKLHDDLNKLLAPWIEGDATAIKFGGKLHVSIVVYFMEQLYYVDHVEQVKIWHFKASETTPVNVMDATLAVATSSRSVLTSSDQHSINLLGV